VRLQFLIRALSLGGAERQLVLLAEGLARRGHTVEVLTFYGGLPVLETRLERGGVRLVRLRKRGRADVFGFFGSLGAAVREFRPDAVYSFLPTANVVSAMVVRRIPGPAIAWGIRASAMNLPGYDWLGRLMARAEIWLRRVPDAVICNSKAGYELYHSLGFSGERLSIARNIIDLESNHFDPTARQDFRRSRGIPDTTLLFGAAGRLDPMKGFENLLRAFADFHSGSREVALAVAGDGKIEYRRHLQQAADAAGIGPRVTWLGRVEDMRSFYSAVDVFCSSSVVAEGTSNVVAEALACGRMTVATDIGDSAELVNDASLVARPGDVASLAAAMARAANRMPSWDGAAARARISEMLAADAALDETERALSRAVNLRRSANTVAREMES
jgi:glycosyltransferase involved in cell wall biosynthesis